MVLVFCRHQEFRVFSQLGDPLMNFLFWFFFNWLSLEWWTFLSFLKINLTILCRFSPAFSLLSTPLPTQCSRNKSYTLHKILKICSDFYTPPSSKTRDANSVTQFLWVWIPSESLRSVQLVIKQLLFFSAPVISTNVTGKKNQILRSKIYLLKMILYVLQHQLFFQE